MEELLRQGDVVGLVADVDVDLASSEAERHGLEGLDALGQRLVGVDREQPAVVVGAIEALGHRFALEIACG